MSDARPGKAALTEQDADLLGAARGARRQAYAPYSRFPVGAAVRTTQGQVFSACNVENRSYGLTMCAERAAVFAAVATEGGATRIATVAISAAAGSCPPCGACRQVLAEFGPGMRVLFPLGGEVVVRSLDELLPMAFDVVPDAPAPS